MYVRRPPGYGCRITVCSAVAETWLASLATSEGVGNDPSVAPLPSSPPVAHPAAYTLPSLSKANVSVPPVTAWVKCKPVSNGVSIVRSLAPNTCPPSLSPHPYRRPAAVIATIEPFSWKSPPAEICTAASGRSLTGVGVSTSLEREPRPSWPNWLAPHVKTLPEVLRAALVVTPAVLSATPLRPGTSTGSSASFTPWTPSRPSRLEPHALTVPPGVSHSEWCSPPCTAWTPEMTLTGSTMLPVGFWHRVP